MADKKIVDLGTGVALGANDSIVLVQGNETLKISGQDVAWGVKTIADLADKSYVDSVAAGGTGEALTQIRNELDQVKNDVSTKLPTANFGLEFWSQLANVSTYHIREDSNLYWTQQRFDDAFANKSTSNLTEGSNLYFTNTRGRASVFDNRDIITFQNGGEVGNAQYQHQGSPYLGMDIYSPNTHDWVQLNYDDKNYVWVTNSYVGIDITKSNGGVVNWLFDETGVLTLPIGGDIVDYYGNSVLGGGSGGGASALSQLSDVYITSPTAGQVLKFNGTKWINGTDSTGGGGGGVGDDPTFNSVTTSTLNVKDINFTGTGPVNLYSSNDVNISAVGRIAFNGSELADVAFSGNYNDLINKPTGGGGSVSWEDITGKPSFATVATSGSYNDLTNKPTAPTFDSVTISGSVTSPTHAATKAYVDSQVNDISAPTWSSLTNISNEFGPTRITLGRYAGGASDADGYGGYGGYGAYGGSSYAIAIGNSAGRENQGGAAIGLGVAAGNTNQGDSAIAIGLTAGNSLQGAAAIAIGESAGRSEQGANAVAIGNTAGYMNQGANAVAIGYRAGEMSQPAGSIIINASGNVLGGSAAGLYIDPIRSSSATDYVAYYNPTTKEVTYGPAPSGGSGEIGLDPTFTSVTTTTLNVQDVNFTGTGAVTINSNNDLNLTAVGNVLLNGERTISLNDLKTVVAASTDFADFKARIAAL